MNFKNSQTYKNLQNAYEGELKSCAKYKVFSERARKQGFQQIANIFDETSGNEQEHAEIWLKFLKGGEIPDTLANLEEAQTEENFQWTKLYQQYAQIAEREGFSEIARLFRGVAGIERHHDCRYSKLIENIKGDQVFCRKEECVWICLNCGNILCGECAPEKCPVCGYPQGFFELNCENY